jgi:hypothetical protein
MSLLWFVLGAFLVFTTWILKTWISKNKINMSFLSWSGIIISTILGFFTIAWIVSSIIEGENRAAGMGLLIFGGMTFIAIGLTQRKIRRDNRGKK